MTLVVCWRTLVGRCACTGIGKYIEHGRQVHEEDVPALEEDENRREGEIQAGCSQPGTA